jgi:transposase
MCELLVGLPDVVVLGVEDLEGGGLRVHVEERLGVMACPACGARAWVKDRPMVELVDLPVFGRPVRLVWHKHRLCCPSSTCRQGSWTVDNPAIAATRMVMTDRAGRWVTWQVGRMGRTVNEVAVELRCDWHTVMDAVVAYGTPLVEDPGRIGEVDAVGMDEVLFARLGRYRLQAWATSIVDVRHGQLLDVVPGRDHIGPARWLERRGEQWCAQIRLATLDLSGPYRAVFDTMLPHATQVADPFHLVRLANTALDECRRRVQNDTLGHRGRKHDPLYRARRLLVRADERLDDNGRARLLGLLEAGDPHGEVRTAWHAKEVVRQIYDHTNAAVAGAWVDDIGRDFTDASCPLEVRRLGRTIRRWRNQIVAWHTAQVTNGPTESMNNLAKRIKRVAFGFRRFLHFRIRALLYAGRPNWHLLATLTPR